MQTFIIYIKIKNKYNYYNIKYYLHFFFQIDIGNGTSYTLYKKVTKIILEFCLI